MNQNFASIVELNHVGSVSRARYDQLLIAADSMRQHLSTTGHEAVHVSGSGKCSLCEMAVAYDHVRNQHAYYDRMTKSLTAAITSLQTLYRLVSPEEQQRLTPIIYEMLQRLETYQ